MNKWLSIMGYSKRQAGEELGVTKGHIRRFERGDLGLRRAYLFAMQYLWECKKNGVEPKLWKEK